MFNFLSVTNQQSLAMKTIERTNKILAGARADLLAIPAEPEPVARLEREDWQWRQDDAANRIVPLRTAAWLGLTRLTHSDTTLCSRALDAGEHLGLWRRVRSRGGRTTHLKLLGADDA